MNSGPTGRICPTFSANARYRSSANALYRSKFIRQTKASWSLRLKLGQTLCEQLMGTDEPIQQAFVPSCVTSISSELLYELLLLGNKLGAPSNGVSGNLEVYHPRQASGGQLPIPYLKAGPILPPVLQIASKPPV
jgi:hypothetical protein